MLQIFIKLKKFQRPASILRETVIHFKGIFIISILPKLLKSFKPSKLWSKTTPLQDPVQSLIVNAKYIKLQITNVPKQILWISKFSKLETILKPNKDTSSRKWTLSVQYVRVWLPIKIEKEKFVKSKWNHTDM